MNIVVSTGKTKSTYSVSVYGNGGGSVTTSASSVTEGDSVVITITPNSGYEVASVSGLDDWSKSGGTYTLPNIKSNISISVTFQAVTPTPTPDPEPTDDKKN